MRRSRSIICLLSAALLVGGCASGPRYGSGKKRKECDCPKWSMRTHAPVDEARTALVIDRTTTAYDVEHAASN